MGRNRNQATLTASAIAAGDIPETDDELAVILREAATYEAPAGDVFSFGDAPTAIRPARDQKHPCLCGCGEMCGARRFFAMGHDARTKSLLANGAMTPDAIPAHIREQLLAGSDSWAPFFSGEAAALVIARRSEKAAKAAERLLAAEALRQDRATKSAARKAARQAADAASRPQGAAAKNETQRKLTAAERMTAQERESLLAAMGDMRAQGLLPDEEEDEEALLAAQEAAEEAADDDESEDILVS